MAAVQQLGEDVAKAAAAPLWPLGDDELAACLRTARRVEQAAVVLQARLVRQATLRGVPTSHGYGSTASWLRSVLLLDVGPSREVTEGAARMARWPHLEQSVLDGRMDWRQALVIAAAVGKIPTDMTEVDASVSQTKDHSPYGDALDQAEPAAVNATGTDRTDAEINNDDHRSADGNRDRSDSTDNSDGNGCHGVCGGTSNDARAAGNGDGSDGVCGGTSNDARAAGNGDGSDGVCGGGGCRVVGGGDGFDGAHGGGSGGERMNADVLAVQAEQTMIEMAGRLSASKLTRVGQRILSYVAPELAERVDQLWLARQEARAHLRRTLSVSAPVDGMVRLSGIVSAEDAATVRAALHPLCTPASGDDRIPGQRRADALVEVCRLALRAGELPEQGGQPAQISVTVSYDPLTRALGVGTTDTGERLSAEAVRRLACDARILPYVLGGAGQVLDVGRARRLATGQLRRALAVRDRGCVFPDCDRPPGWTDAHHIIGWLAGGPTTLENLALVCRMHHRLLHHPGTGWRIRLGPGGLPEFIPPPHIDLQQRPRRNLYHRRE